MRLKIASKQILLAVILIGFIFCAAFIFYFIILRSTQNISVLSIKNSVTSPTQAELSSFVGQTIVGPPVRLKIPAINVDAFIEYVGLTPDGAVDVPKNPANAAWFNAGPQPGENGSAVITGHYGRWKNGETSVFDNLYKLKKGDKLYVENAKGVITAFVVQEIRNYKPDAYAYDVFISSDGKSHLNLITCDGVWDNNVKSYSKRLVVFTDKE